MSNSEAAKNLDEFGLAWTREEVVEAISRAMKSGSDASEVLSAIEATGCRVVYKGGTVGMVRALIRALHGLDHNPPLGSYEFRRHYQALENAIDSSPIGKNNSTNAG
jgi:hypothetical protein